MDDIDEKRLESEELTTVMKAMNEIDPENFPVELLQDSGFISSVEEPSVPCSVSIGHIANEVQSSSGSAIIDGIEGPAALSSTLICQGAASSTSHGVDPMVNESYALSDLPESYESSEDMSSFGTNYSSLLSFDDNLENISHDGIVVGADEQRTEYNNNRVSSTQDERRKQRNRESARRSRERKKNEIDSLKARNEELRNARDKKKKKVDALRSRRDSMEWLSFMMSLMLFDEERPFHQEEVAGGQDHPRRNLERPFHQEDATREQDHANKLNPPAIGNQEWQPPNVSERSVTDVGCPISINPSPFNSCALRPRSPKTRENGFQLEKDRNRARDDRRLLDRGEFSLRHRNLTNIPALNATNSRPAFPNGANNSNNISYLSNNHDRGNYFRTVADPRSGSTSNARFSLSVPLPQRSNPWTVPDNEETESEEAFNDRLLSVRDGYSLGHRDLPIIPAPNATNGRPAFPNGATNSNNISYLSNNHDRGIDFRTAADPRSGSTDNARLSLSMPLPQRSNPWTVPDNEETESEQTFMFVPPPVKQPRLE